MRRTRTGGESRPRRGLDLLRGLGIPRAGAVLVLVLVTGASQASVALARASTPYRPGILVVGFQAGVPASLQRRLERQVGGRWKHPLGQASRSGRAASRLERRIGTSVVLGVSRGGVLSAARALRRHRRWIRYAEPDYLMQASGVRVPDDPGFSLEWGSLNSGQLVQGVVGVSGVDDRAALAWGVSTGSRGVVIGEVDTGVDFTHPDLAGNVWSNPGGVGGCAAGTHGYNVVAGSCSPMDDDTVYGGHGTHVAGIMGAVGDNGVGVAGVNWSTTILPVKWLDSNASGSTSQLISALDWLVGAKAAGVNVRVVNDSATFVGTAYSQALSDEIDLLGADNILFVTAAGNTGQDNDNPAYTRYPCGYDRPTEICVTATDQNDQLPSWANWGATKVDLGAPGESIYSTLRNDSYGYINGGSMAAAQVSGAAALILSTGDQSTTNLKADILNNVDPIPALTGKTRTGGRLNICKAIPTCLEPVVTSIGPADGTTGVAGRADVYAVFNEAMDHPSTAAAFTLVRTSDGAPVAGSMVWFGDRVPIFLPSSTLAPNTQYTANISTAATDQSGAHLPAAKTWQFTTAPGPAVSTFGPADGASGVYPNVSVYAVFSSPMDEAATQAAFSLGQTGTGTAVGGRFSWYGPTAMIFTPSSDLATGVRYTASVSAAARDSNGNGLSAAKSWQFTTVNQPVIDQVSPALGATGVATGGVVYALFSEAMDHPSTAAAFTLRRASDGAPVGGSIVWFGDHLPIFIPSQALAPNTTYAATISAAATDQSARALANPTTWRFTTGSSAGPKLARSSAPTTRRSAPAPRSLSTTQLEHRLRRFAASVARR
jgi:subtilisin family serine protease